MFNMLFNRFFKKCYSFSLINEKGTVTGGGVMRVSIFTSAFDEHKELRISVASSSPDKRVVNFKRIN